MKLGNGYYWVLVDEDGEPTDPPHICSAWWGESDRPTVGTWILVKEVQISTKN